VGYICELALSVDRTASCPIRTMSLTTCCLNGANLVFRL